MLLVWLLVWSSFLHADEVAPSWRLGVISDMNRSYGSTEYTQALFEAIHYLKGQPLSAVLSTGDMVAGQKPGLDYARMWAAFHQVVTEPLSQHSIPLLPSPGNHDASLGRKFAEEREQYRQTWRRFPITRFNTQKDTAQHVQWLGDVPQNFPFNYAVTLGPALLISLDATTVGPLSSAQVTWLESVLTRGRAFPLKILFGHMPLLPFAFQRAHESLALDNPPSSISDFPARFEALLERHNVQLFLTGHHHAYFDGLRSGKVRYISVPLLGTGARVLLTQDRSITENSPQGFLLIEFNERGHFRVQAMSSPGLTEIPRALLPPAISLPSVDSADCRGCAQFPQKFFLNSRLRTLYIRN